MTMTILTVGLIYAITTTHVVAADQTTIRSWTEAATNRTIQGRMLRVEGTNLVLQRSDGQIFEIPLDRLTSEDRDYAMKTVPQSSVAPNAASPDASSDPAASTRTVVAEGVGLTPEHALKDAFRAAVRQVVGEVVDAETLVENDQIVRDQVLVYSAGFIPTHTKLSETSEGGLFRITIRAVVERQKLELRLRAANVSIRPIDGQSLFGSIVTQVEKEKDAAALLKAVLEGFPENYLEAHIAGPPEVVQKDENRATLRFLVRVTPNIVAYKTFASRLEKTLKTIAVDHEPLSIEFTDEHRQREPGFDRFDRYRTRAFDRFHGWKTLLPKSFTADAYPILRSDVVTVAVAHPTRTFERLDMTSYLLHPSVQSVLAEAACISSSCRISILASRSEELVGERFPVVETRRARPDGRSVLYEPTLLAPVGFARIGSELDIVRDVSWLRQRRGDIRIYFVTPLFLNHCIPGDVLKTSLHQTGQLTIARDFSFTLDEVKSITGVKCELLFDRSR